MKTSSYVCWRLCEKAFIKPKIDDIDIATVLKPEIIKNLKIQISK